MKQKTANPVSPELAPALEQQIHVEALKLHAAGELDKAEILYRAALVLNPSHSESHYHLGLIYHSQRRLDEAVIAYRDAIFARIDFAEAYAHIATATQEQGKRPEAEIFYRQSLAYAPFSASTHNNFGVLCNEM